jgi:hypothetical protein
VFVGSVYDLDAGDATFERPVMLTFKYSPAEVASIGSPYRLRVYRLDEATGEWERVESRVSITNSAVYVWVDHFSIYAKTVQPSCDDGVQSNDEEGIDCGGDCPSECVDCQLAEHPTLEELADLPRGSGPISWTYSFESQYVFDAAQEAVQYYADNVTNPASEEAENYTTDEIYKSADLKMEAVAFYVHRHMAWMLDDLLWFGSQTATKTLTKSGDRFGWADYNILDLEPPDYYIFDEKIPCDKINTYAGDKFPGVYCGDCEDFAILRASLLWHLGVSSECVYLPVYHGGKKKPAFKTEQLEAKQRLKSGDSEIDIYSGPREPYDYDRASDLFDGYEGNSLLGLLEAHVFNVVLYKNKYRIMDYQPLGYYFSTATEQEHHKIHNIVNDQFGKFSDGFSNWFVDWRFDDPFPSANNPADYIQNYPGEENEKCYAPYYNLTMSETITLLNDIFTPAGYLDYWTNNTLYREICP